jgi:hypothetical protein
MAGLSAIVIAVLCGCTLDAVPAPSMSSDASASFSPARGETAFALRTDAGKTMLIDAPGDCAAVADPWLEGWCRDLVVYEPGDLPTALKAGQRVDQDLLQRIYAALFWSMLHGDDTICQNDVVAAFVSFTAAPPPSPMPTTLPAQHCREELRQTSENAAREHGAISWLTPGGSTQISVALPGGQPLPTFPG